MILVKDGPRKIKNSNALDSLFADLDQDLEQQYEEEEFEFFLMGKFNLYADLYADKFSRITAMIRAWSTKLLRVNNLWLSLV